MFKKSLTMLFLAAILLTSPIIGDAIVPNIDKSNLNSGLITINFKSSNNLASAVRIEKGNEKKDYILGGNNNFPLQFGEGAYTITVLESAGGNKFRQIEKERVNFKAGNKNDIYLQSIQMINWNKDMVAIKKAKEITKGRKTDKEKVSAIYEYITNNIHYDNNKASNVKPGYISSIDSTLLEGQGICYDYAALFAGMARSLNIPTKLVEGRKNDIKEFHAWNQVYLKETNEWIIVDTTYDRAYKKANKAISMIKDTKEYKIEKEY